MSCHVWQAFKAEIFHLIFFYERIKISKFAARKTSHLSQGPPGAQILKGRMILLGKNTRCLPCSYTLPPDTFCWSLEERVHWHRWIFYFDPTMLSKVTFSTISQSSYKETADLCYSYPLYTPQHVWPSPKLLMHGCFHEIDLKIPYECDMLKDHKNLEIRQIFWNKVWIKLKLI